MSIQWPFTAEINPNRLASRFLELNQFENEFALLTGENYVKAMGLQPSPAGDSDNPQPTGAMIEVFQDLNAGGTELRIPVIKPASAMPAFGDTDVTNLGAQASIMFRRAEVNQIEFPYDLVKGMQQQIIGLANANRINQGANEIRYMWTRFTDKDLYHTVLNGVSMALTTMSGIQGARATLTPHSHGNFYVPVNGMVSYSNGRPGTAAYETDVNSALNTIQNTADYQMTPELIERLEYEADLKKIPYFKTPAGEFRVLIVHASQARQLRANKDYRDGLKYASMGEGFGGVMYNQFQTRWSKTIIFESTKSFGVQGTIGNVTNWGSAYNGIPKYGPSDVYTNLDAIDTNPIKMAIMCGPSMITKAFGVNPVTFTGHVNEAANKQLLIMRSIYAYVLSDIYDLDGLTGLTAGSFLENNSSLVAATYSPN